jgi:ATP-dependent Clp protease ATP-binding subunit ClpA
MPPELNDATRHAVRSASEFARESGSEFAETEHLLLALLAEPDETVIALLTREQAGNGSGSIFEHIAAELRQRMTPGELVPHGKIPLSPIARQAVAFAGEVAEQLGADWVEPAHLLIGLLRERRGLAAEILRDAGYDADALRQQLHVSAESRLSEAAKKPVNGSHEGLIETLIDFESGLTYLERRDDARVYIPRSDVWQAHVKRGGDKLYCYLKLPGDEAFHMILNGEIFLQRGDEKYCLDCALRHGFATRDRLHWQRVKREKQPGEPGT